jgi:ferredoxin
MVTYLASLWIADSKSFWWAHTLALVAFLPLIPHTKHLHLVLSPVSVFLSRGTFARIPPLAGDEDFGLDTAKTDSNRRAAGVFLRRMRALHRALPRIQHGKGSEPQGNRLGVRGYLNEFVPASEEPLLGKYISQEAAFQCTTCGACEFQCPVGVEHVPSSSACGAER